MRRRLLHAVLSAGLLLPLGLALNYTLNVVLARLLPVDGFGLFGFVQSLTAVLAVVATLGFSQSMMRFTAAYVGNSQFDLLAGLLRYSLRLVAVSALVAAVILALAGGFASTRGEALFWSAALMLPLAIDVWRESAMRGLHRTAEAIAPRHVLLPLLTLGAVLAVQTQDVTVVMAIYLVLVLCLETLGLLRLGHLARQLTGPVSASIRSEEWIAVSWPMALTSLAVQGMARWDIMVVGLMLGMEEAGLYTAAARTALLANLVLRGINLIIGPMLAESYHTGKLARFKRLFFVSALLSGVLGLPFYVAVMVYTEYILQLFGMQYRHAADLLQILATGQFVNLVTGPVALALNMSNYQNLLSRTALFFGTVSIIATTVAAVLSGPVGVAYATAATMVAMNLVLLTFFWRRAS